MRKKRGGYQVKRLAKTKKSLLKILIYGGLFFCLVLASAYFFIFSPFFWIKKIEIKGAESVPVREIENIVQNALSEKILEIIPQKSVILIPIHKIKTNILGAFPKIAEVEIHKKVNLDFPLRDNILEIKIKERESVGVWCEVKKTEILNDIKDNTSTDAEIIEKEEKGQCFYIDKEGVIYKESPVMDGGLILVINDLRKQDIRVGELMVSKELVGFILFAREKLPEILNFRALDFNVVSVEDLRMLTSLGWQIYFNPQKSVDKQIEVLKRVLEEEVKEKQESLEYVDLRIENRAYYKIK